MSWQQKFPPINSRKVIPSSPSSSSSNQENDQRNNLENRMLFKKLEKENSILKDEVQRSAEERRSLHQAVRALSSLVERDARELTDLKGGLNLQRKETETLMSLLRDTLKNGASLEDLGEIRNGLRTSTSSQEKKISALESRNQLLMSEITSLKKTQEDFRNQFSNFSSRTLDIIGETESRTRSAVSNAESLHQSLVSSTSMMNEMKEKLNFLEAQIINRRDSEESVHRKLASHREEMIRLLEHHQNDSVQKESSSPKDLLIRISDLANRVASNELNMNRALSENRDLIVQKISDLVQRNESSRESDSIVLQQCREVQRSLATKLREIESENASEKQRNEENMIRLSRELENRTRSWSFKLEKGSDRERSVEEILRVEVQERMRETSELRERVSSLTSHMSRAIERVHEQSTNVQSEILESLEQQKNRMKDTINTIRASTSDTIQQLSNRIEEQHQSVYLQVEDMRQHVHSIRELEREMMVRSQKDQVEEEEEVLPKQKHRRMSKPPDDSVWEKVEDELNGTYYYNRKTGISQWHDPTIKAKIASVPVGEKEKHEHHKKVDLEPIQSELNELRRDIEHSREETEIRFVEARQERNLIRKSQRVMSNQHDASLSLFQSTLQTHAAYVGEMEKKRVIADVMDGMISSVERLALKDYIMKSVENMMKNVEKEEASTSTITKEEEEEEKEEKEEKGEEEEKKMDPEVDRILKIEDVTIKLKQDLETLREKHRETSLIVSKNTSRLERKISSMESRIELRLVKDTIKSEIEKEEGEDMRKIKNQIEEQVEVALKNVYEKCMSEIDTQVKSSEKKILNTVEMKRKQKEKDWQDELIHAQAFLDGLKLPLPEEEEEEDGDKANGSGIVSGDPKLCVGNIWEE